MSETEIEFWIDGSKYALEFRSHIPQRGDEVRFKGIVYKVSSRIFIYDDVRYRIALEIDKVGTAPLGGGAGR